MLGNEELVGGLELFGLQLVEHHGQRHQLGHTGGFELLVTRLVEQDRAGFVVHQHCKRRLGVEILRQCGSRPEDGKQCD